MSVILVQSGTALASLLSPAASDHHLDGLNVICLHEEVNRLVPFWPITTFHVSDQQNETSSTYCAIVKS